MVLIIGKRNEVQLLTTAIHSLGRDNGHTDDKEGFRRTQTQMIGSVRGYLLSTVPVAADVGRRFTQGHLHFIHIG